MMNSYNYIKEFMRKYPMTIAWRVKQHCKVIDKHLNSNEKILYMFVGQKNNRAVDIFNTYVVVFTNKRIIVATKRVVFGYFFKSITSDMYNDLTIHKGLIWGKVTLDAPMPNPAFEKQICQMLGIKQADMRKVIAGEMTIEEAQGK